MKNVLKKLYLAKASVAQMKNKKEGSNSFSKYEYFTPEQVNKIVQTVNDEQGLFTAFSLKRNEFGVYGVLTVYDIESWESMDFEMASEIPDIKATVGTQQLGWCVTYTERYLLMSVYWIKDNSLDLDSDEQYKTRTKKKAEVKEDIKFDDEPSNPEPDWFEKAKQSTKYMLSCMDEDDFINKIKSKYKLTKQQETDLRICYKNALAMDKIDLPFKEEE